MGRSSDLTNYVGQGRGSESRLNSIANPKNPPDCFEKEQQDLKSPYPPPVKLRIPDPPF